MDDCYRKALGTTGFAFVPFIDESKSAVAHFKEQTQNDQNHLVFLNKPNIQGVTMESLRELSARNGADVFAQSIAMALLDLWGRPQLALETIGTTLKAALYASQNA